LGKRLDILDDGRENTRDTGTLKTDRTAAKGSYLHASSLRGLRSRLDRRNRAVALPAGRLKSAPIVRSVRKPSQSQLELRQSPENSLAGRVARMTVLLPVKSPPRGHCLPWFCAQPVQLESIGIPSRPRTCLPSSCSISSRLPLYPALGRGAIGDLQERA
jgi:hypothetical protein